MTTESGELSTAAPASTAALVDALTALRDAATEIHFTLPVAGAERAPGDTGQVPGAPPGARIRRVRGRRVEPGKTSGLLDGGAQLRARRRRQRDGHRATLRDRPRTAPGP